MEDLQTNLQDYSNIGLDPLMRPLDSLISVDRGFVSNTLMDSNYESVFANKVVTGVLRGRIDIGSTGGVATYIRIDGVNNRIIVNDGTNDRILIGFQTNGF